MTRRIHLPVPLPTTTAVAAAMAAHAPHNPEYLATKKWLAELYVEGDPKIHEYLAVTQNGYWGHAVEAGIGLLVKQRGEEKGCPIMTRIDFIEAGRHVNRARPHIHAELGLGYRRNLALAAPAPVDPQAGG